MLRIKRIENQIAYIYIYRSCRRKNKSYSFGITRAEFAELKIKNKMSIHNDP